MAPDRADGDSVPAIHAKVSAEKGGKGKVLRRNGGQRKSESVTQTVWPTGAVIKLPQSGLILRFPAGAVAQPLSVTLIALPGDIVAYEFLPHGAVFDQPVLVQQDLKGTKAEGDAALMSQLRGAFLENGAADIDAAGNANVAEAFITQLYNEGGPKFRQARFTIRHFSGYILASGILCDLVQPYLGSLFPPNDG